MFAHYPLGATVRIFVTILHIFHISHINIAGEAVVRSLWIYGFATKRQGDSQKDIHTYIERDRHGSLCLDLQLSIECAAHVC